jgi:hypothetical protein
MGEKRYSYRVVIGKREGRSPFGRHRHRWEDDIKIAIKWNGGCEVNFIRLEIRNIGDEPPGSTKYREFLDLLRNY